MAHKILALSLPFPGVCRVLEHGKGLELWKFICLKPEHPPIPGADIVMLGAWSPSYSSLIESLHFERLGVLWTSSAGEMGFESYEQQALRAILENPKISFVWFGDKSLARLFPEKGFWAPYPLDIPSPLPAVLPKSDIMTLFCPDTAKKNTFNQLVAAVFLQRKLGFLRLETNIGIPEVIRSELRCRQHGWLPEDKYKSILS